jgi:PAS domain S-box-containing protein
VSEFENLLSTLAERERMLRDLQADASHAQTLSHAMDRIYGCDDLERGIRDALDLCQEATGADLWILLRRSEGAVTTLAISGVCHPEPIWADPQDRLSRLRHVADVREVPWFNALPQQLREYLSQISVPIAGPSEPHMAIMLLSRRRAAFSRSDQSLTRRVGRLLEQATVRQWLAHRNRILARALYSSDTSPSPAGFHDTSFDALSHAYSRLAYWQGQIVEITNELLSASPAQARTAIEHALARTGRLANADRTYVFRLREPDRLDNTHEWVAPGIAPMIMELQDMPDSLLDDWRSDLSIGNAVHIPDVAALPDSSGVKDILQMQEIRSLLVVPMLRNGRVTGFTGYDAVRAHRQYLPVEITLLKSVANVVNVVLERAAAESEAKAAQAGLEAERNKLQATLAAIPDLVLELDSEGRFAGHVSGAGLQPVVPTSELLGRMPDEVLPADVAKITRQVTAIVDHDGQTAGHEYELKVDGELRWFQLSAAAKLHDGLPAGYVFVIRDITERASERRQLQRLSKIAELTSNLVVITDKDQQIEWVNPAFERRTGWTLEEVRGRRPDSFLATERTDRAEMHRIGAALRAKQPVRAELLNRNRAGQDYWISKDIQPLFDASEQLTGFIAVQTDISELKQSHQRTQQDYIATLDSSNDGIAITDSEGQFVYMNPVHRRMFGITETEDVRLLNWQDLYLPETVERFMAEEWESLQTTGQWRGEMIGRRRDGSPVVQEVSLSLRDDGILCITRDISDRLRLEADRTRLREELQIAQRRETVAHLAAEVGHDLSNLVAVVEGSASLIEDTVQDDDVAQSGIERILRATDAAKHLVSTLGDLGQTQKKSEWQDLRVLIKEGVDLLGARRVKDHDISVELPEFPRLVWADHSGVLQVILNLALNACEATGDCRNRVRLAIIPATSLPQRSPDTGIFCPDTEYVMFTVSDTGKGIDAEMQKHLFDRHFSTKRKARSGLGLPIVARILLDNNAALWVDSTPGKGTIMTVAWPSQCPDKDTQIRSIEPPASGLDLTGCNILVVDDLPDVADILSEMIETTGAMAAAVSDPAEALELLRDNPGVWSALVTDYDMPTVRGTDLARTAADCSPPVPAILVSAVTEVIGPDAELFHKVLSKPIDAALLIAAVRAVVAITRTDDEMR